MRVLPAVDILDGQCVQLVQGKRDTATSYGDPLDWARHWVAKGAEHLHVINLNGAFGESQENAGIIRRMLEETGADIQLGGGIRTVEDAVRWLNIGVDRVILGTLAVTRPESIRELSDDFGSQAIMAGVDSKGGEVVAFGWKEPAGDYLLWARKFEELGAGSLLFTNVDLEGLCQGINAEPVRRLLASTHLPVVVAGGITGIDDVRTLKSLGVAGIVLGSALYSGKIDFEAAREVAT
ncbi:MAG: 1-(5-phosphoribosyl)-5-[(5-phosphoribosylamino)methylideneamino]imidazole-4-carboxamide isomerase [Methanomicrobiaceae archaeon]|nr:1-(5-phosphoribosyl)-5-[(5-phosphoribosylamino)methylideneamino]imidazole-4-carboxamide isomerase [Methanomicrobiaceae archaeon]